MPHTLNAQGRTSWLFAVSILAFGLAPADAHAYYHPTVGRWIQRDPIGYADGRNLYEYARSSPSMHRDPEGTKCCIEYVEFMHSMVPIVEREDRTRMVGGRPVYQWRITQRVEITAYLTPDSNPKDCALRQRERMIVTYRGAINTTQKPLKIPTFDWYVPDPVDPGVDRPRSTSMDWDLVEYGDNWVKWWDTPGIYLRSDVNSTKVQEFPMAIKTRFFTYIYDKSVRGAATVESAHIRWWGQWESLIWRRLHIKQKEIVYRDLHQSHTTLLGTGVAKTRDMEME